MSCFMGKLIGLTMFCGSVVYIRNYISKDGLEKFNPVLQALKKNEINVDAFSKRLKAFESFGIALYAPEV